MAASPASRPAAVPATRRVVSVAPKDSAEQPLIDVFLSPRVIDEQAVADFRATIESLLVRAESLHREVNEVLGRASVAREDGAAVTARLEDRVQLGARMLRAFETQLARMEEAVSRVQEVSPREPSPVPVDTSAIDAAVASGVQSIERASEDSAWRMEKLLDHALSRIREAAMSQLRITFNMPRETDPLVALAQRLHALESRLTSLESGGQDHRPEEAATVAVEPLVDRVLEGVRAGLRQEMAAWPRLSENPPSARPVRQPTLSLRAAEVDDDVNEADAEPKRAAGWG